MSKQLRSQKGWGEPLGWIAAENETEEVQQVVDRMIQVLTSNASLRIMLFCIVPIFNHD